jgi:hypothetical protein
MTCSHSTEKSTWVEEDDWYPSSGGSTGYWEYETVSTTVDIDLHRYKCTQCNEIFYYSGRARQYHEEGKKFDWIKGLDK